MAYSMKTFRRSQDHEFPAPPQYLTWVEEVDYRKKENTGKGQLRHYANLAKARDHVRAYAKPNRWTMASGHSKDGEFRVGWAIYKWDQDAGKYELLYEGAAGSTIDHPLFKMRFSKADKNTERELSEDDVEAALASIREAAS